MEAAFSLARILYQNKNQQKNCIFQTLQASNYSSLRPQFANNELD